MNYIDDAKIDLTSCDREPIHALGAIQQFGCLIAFSSDWLIAQKSTNCAEMLGIPADHLESGRPLDAIVDDGAVNQLRDRMMQLETDRVVRLFAIDLLGDERLWDCALHCVSDLTVLEIEPHDETAFQDHIEHLRDLMRRLDKERGLVPLCQHAAEELQTILGFDRVMVYRFHADLSGEVIAESHAPGVDSFMGLRYPKTDIPQQARELYKRNLFRIIADVREQPVPIEPELRVDGSPLDLSLSTLRAVSPIHLEYLRNMGVEASLSISILQDGKLWGLFACHHYSPRPLPYGVRTMAELFAELFSLQLQIAIDRGVRTVAERGRDLHNRLMAQIANGDRLIDSLPTLEKAIGAIIPHDGASIFIDGQYRIDGKAPNEEEFRAIVPALNTASASRVFASEALAERIPAAEAFADRAAGALVIPVSRRPRDYIVLWRSELAQTVNWAGNPEKPVELGPRGARLTPRKSFAAWKQSVSGSASPWTPAELQVAEGLRVSLLEIILKLTDDAVKERARNQQQQELLIAELNHRVRNILNLIRGLVAQSGAGATSVEGLAQTIGGRINALAIAHDSITHENWSPASLRTLIENETKAYLDDKAGRVTVNGPDFMIQPEAYTVVALVLHEMITNSAKYGSLCDSRGTLKISLTKDDNGDLEMLWKESGGPPVRPPTRRGFGSTIIERSIPFELKGEATVDYKLSGVEARFVVPGMHVDRVVEASSGAGKETSASRDSDKPKNDGHGSSFARALVVEDSMIIAMDTQDMLEQLGVGSVRTAASVGDAIRAIEEAQPDFALLDYNLGSESSVEVAERLSQLGVPFYFASGYGEGIETEGTSALGVLKKPYSRDDLAAAMEQVGA